MNVRSVFICCLFLLIDKDMSYKCLLLLVMVFFCLFLYCCICLFLTFLMIEVMVSLNDVGSSFVYALFSIFLFALSLQFSCCHSSLNLC